MKSTKRQTSSKSGKSEKSMTKAGSSPNESSSATAPASFAQVFGNDEPALLVKLKNQLREAQERQRQHLGDRPTATAPRLFKTLHRQRGKRLERQIRDLTEAIESLTD